MIIVEIAGYLGSDAEERYTSGGKRVITLRIATRVRHGGKDETVWWKVSIWDDRFDKMLPYLKKGTPIIVIGEMGKPETYVDREGKTQISLTMSAQIVKFSPFGRNEKTQEGGTGSQVAPPIKRESPSHSSSPLMEEEMATMGSAHEEGTHYSGDDLPF